MKKEFSTRSKKLFLLVISLAAFLAVSSLLPLKAQAAETETAAESESEAPTLSLKTDKSGNIFCYKDGEKVYGEQNVDGRWMYFTKKTGAVRSQFHYFKKGSRLCYYDGSGYRLSGTHTVKGVKCTFSKSSGNLTGGRKKLIQKFIGTAKTGRSIAGICGYTPGSKVKSKLNSAIRSIEKSGYSVSFLMIDVNTMQGISYNPNKKYYSASSIKGPYVVSVISKKPSVLSSYKGTIRKILKYSDNDAYIGFAKHFGFGFFNSWVSSSSASYKRSGGNRCYGYFSAKNMAKIWCGNYYYFNSSSVGSRLGKMFESPNVSAIHSTLGSRYTTRSKAGWIAMGGRHSVTNDAGIVYSNDGSYIIVMLSTVPSQMGRLNRLVRAIDYAHADMTD